MFAKARKFFVEARQELGQVHWPTRHEAVYLSWIVVVVSLLLALFLGAFDYLFTFLLKLFVL